MKDFYWGTATAAYQIEGAVNEDGRGQCVWDVFTRQPHAVSNGDTGDIADDAYHKVKEDVQIMKDMGLNAYRFSISWSRILPSGYGEVNQAGVDHYNYLIDALLKAGITPFVTLYHWDLPQGLEDKYGGLLSPELEKDFTNYADICFRNFGDRVKKWVTLNEPWTVAYKGYGIGTHAPGRCSNRNICAHGDSATESYIVGHNLLNAHAAAVELYRKKYKADQRGEIGIVLNLDWGEPLTMSYIDHAAAARHNEFQLAWFADPVFFGRYPSSMKSRAGARLPEFTREQHNRLVGSLDFLGLNHYSSRYFVDGAYMQSGSAANASLLFPAAQAKALGGGDLGTGWAFDQFTYSSKYDLHGRLIGRQAESDWLNAVPWGFFDVLMYVHNRYSIVYTTTITTSSTPAATNSTPSTRRNLRDSVQSRDSSSSSVDADSTSVGSAEEGDVRTAGVTAAVMGGTMRVPIYVTENGCDAPGEARMPLEQALQDDFRISYLSGYISELQRARRWGVDIRGYFVWSLLDNFEWDDGYDKRFGLVHVDYSSPDRTRRLKDSARWYAKYVLRAFTPEGALAEQQMASSITSGGKGGGGYDKGHGAVDGTNMHASLETGAGTGTGVSLAESGLFTASAVLLLIILLTVIGRLLHK